MVGSFLLPVVLPSRVETRHQLLKTHALSSVDPIPFRVSELITDANNLYLEGRIDDPANLADDRIYAFHGTEDVTVFPPASAKIQDFYQHFIMDPANTTLNMGRRNLFSSHTFITIIYGILQFSLHIMLLRRLIGAIHKGGLKFLGFMDFIPLVRITD